MSLFNQFMQDSGDRDVRLPAFAMKVSSSALSWYAVPNFPAGVYGIGLGARRVTFKSQQERALNLIYYLVSCGVIKPGSKVAIVGAGLSGLTCAAACCARGCEVTLIEAKDEAFALFAQNDQRPIFPNLYLWPNRESSLLSTDFPFFNWSCGSPQDVVSQIKQSKWPNYNLPRTWYGMAVTRLASHSTGRIFLTATRTLEGLPAVQQEVFDVVILAIGFGTEAIVKGINCPRYWSVDDSHQDLSPHNRPLEVLISGTGDGAIMDMLKFSIKNFDLAKLYEPSVPDSMMDETFMAQMASIEAGAPSDRFEAAAYFASAYQSIPMPVNLRKQLRKRGHVRVTVNIADSAFLNANVLPFNRYLAHALNVLGFIEVVALGRLEKGKVLRNGKTRAYFETPRGVETREFDRIIPRHGPVLLESELVTQSTLNQMRELHKSTDDPTLIRAWPSDFFTSNLEIEAPTDFEERKFAIFGLSMSSLHDLVNESEQSRIAHSTLNRRIGL